MRAVLTYERAKKVAKHLKRALDAAGHPANLSLAQETLAYMLGYQHWHEFRRRSVTVAESSAHDDAMAPERLAARLRFQAERLAERLDLPLELALRIVEVAPPIGRQLPTDLLRQGPFGEGQLEGVKGAALMQMIERRLDERREILPSGGPDAGWTREVPHD
jgi:hypothetical protein